MLLKQSLAVDTTKLAKSFDSISHDISLLKEYMRKNKSALYVTPQIIDQEEPKSIIVLRMRRKNKEVLMTMINPIILNIKDTIAVEETQDGVEGTYLNIRHPQLHVAYLALPGATPTEVTLTGKSALVFQQALRLTQGIAIDTFGLRVDNYEEYKNGTEEEKQEIIKEYLRALSEISQESLEDPDTQEYIKATEYMAENAQKSVEKEFIENAQSARDEIKKATEKILAEKKQDKKD